MFEEEIFSEENIQLIHENRKVITWKRVAIITGVFLLSPLPGIVVGYFYNQKLTTRSGNENSFSLPISILIGALVSSLLTFSITTPFFYKKIFSSWYQQRDEIKYISKFSNDIKSLNDDFNNIIKSNSENIKIELEAILTKLNYQKYQLYNQEKPLICQSSLEKMIDDLINLVIHQLVNSDYQLVRKINDIINSCEDTELDLNSSEQLLVY